MLEYHKKRKAIQLRYVQSLAVCPRCGKKRCVRHSFGKRFIHDLAFDIDIVISKHYCAVCRKYFSIRLKEAGLGRRYSYTVEETVYDLYKEGHTMKWIRYQFESKYKLHLPISTILDCIKRERGKNDK